jgi:hypothetical protein
VRTAAVLLPLLLSSCVSFNWSRERRFEPIPNGALESLEVGKSTLSDCLDRLGAPLYVWEYKIDGAALAWGFEDEDARRFSVSFALDRFLRPSFSYGAVDARLRGAVLLFDEHLVLRDLERGYLRSIQLQTVRSGVPEPTAPEEAPRSP